jgi:CheY-like chemotaxis protein
MATAESTGLLHHRLQGLWLLYVDDDTRVCGSVRRLLGSAGAICHVASSHDHAVELLREDRRVTLGILDYQMPDGDVAALVRRLRVVRPRLPLLGTSGTDRRTDFHSRGVDRFIQKPWRLDDLIRSIDFLPSPRDLSASDEIGTPSLPDRVQPSDGAA